MCRGVLVGDTNICHAVFHRGAMAQTGKRIKGLGAVTD